MDTLDLYIHENTRTFKDEPKTIIEQIIVFTVNNEKLPLVDSLHFLLSYNKTVNIELFTCSCGVAGCAGWFDGINVKNRKHTVEWRIMDSKKQRKQTNVNRFYSFSKQNYEDSCLKCIKLLVEIEKKMLTVPEYANIDEYGSRHNLLYCAKWLADMNENSSFYPLLATEYKKEIGDL